MFFELPGYQLNNCIIGIGSNIDAGNNIKKMLDLLGLQVKITGLSEFIITKPIGIENQPDFTNGAVKILTDLSFSELTSLLKKIEDDLGRDRTAPKFGPRTIDLDIVVWNGKIVDPDYYSRDFLQRLIAELQ